MRVAVSRQHPLHLQVTQTSNGKFLVRNNQDVQQPKKSEETTVPPVVFPSCEPVKTAHQGPTILGDRFLLLGPAEGSTLYRCVDVKTGQHLVAKVSISKSRYYRFKKVARLQSILQSIPQQGSNCSEKNVASFCIKRSREK